MNKLPIQGSSSHAFRKIKSFFKWCFLTWYIGTSSHAIAQNRDHYPPSGTPDRIMLNVTANPANSVAVTWRTAVYVSRGYVQITLADPSPDLEKSARVLEAKKTIYVSDKSGAHYFSRVIADLDQNTLYAYRVGDSTEWSEWAHFKTASATEGAFFLYLLWRRPE